MKGQVQAEERMRPASMTMWSVAALGIGSMVGAGIFALLGQAALMAGDDIYLSFIIGGVVALLSGHSYARLAARYPGPGGIRDYFDRAFPSKLVSGALSILYLTTLIITIAMIAKTFGAYAARLSLGDNHPGSASSMFASGIVILLVLLNMVGSAAVGRAEIALVAIKLTILVVLMLAGLPGVRPAMLVSGPTVGAGTLLASVGLTFFAYAGFGMMANAAGDVRDPAVTIPRAIFLAIITVILLYVGLSVVVMGNVPPDELKRFATTAVAEAARPVLGHIGFVIVSIGALLATASAINATLYSALNIADALAADRQLPAMFGHRLWGRATSGLLFATMLILVMIVWLDLGAIANAAGAVFLISYLAVFVAHMRLRHETGSSLLPIVAGLGLMAVVLVTFLASLWSSQPLSLWLVAGCIGVSLLAEWLTRKGVTAR
jgi:amino acid transporter